MVVKGKTQRVCWTNEHNNQLYWCCNGRILSWSRGEVVGFSPRIHGMMRVINVAFNCFTLVRELYIHLT